MKKPFKRKFNIYTVLFSIMTIILGAYCVDHYIVEYSTQMSSGTLLSTIFVGGIIPWIKNDKFVPLQQEEMKDFEVDDLAEYHKALSEDKEVKLKELIEGKASNDDLKKLQEEVSTMKEASNDEAFTKSLTDLEESIQKQIDEAGIEITKLKDGNGTNTGKTLKDIMKEALESDGIKTHMEKGATGISEKVEMDVKAVVDLTGFTGDVVTPARFGPDVSFLPPKKFDIRTSIATGRSDVDSIDHIKETGFVDATGFLAENVASAESDMNLEQVKTSSTRIATHINVSKRSLRNVAFLVSHLTNRFTELIADKITDSVLNGDGTGNTFDGFFNNAATFTAGSLANKVDEANIADVLSAAIARLNEITNLQASAIFMNPLDEFLLTVTKDTTGQYAESSVVVSRINGRLHINGVPVWATHHVASDKYLVADLFATTTELLEVEGLSMMIADQHGTNAIENQVTFIFETEAILPIYKTFAFLKGTLSTDRVLLETA
ncbi:MAG: phage major capsid protein [Candidatus Anammoxibacter sp.]